MGKCGIINIDINTNTVDGTRIIEEIRADDNELVYLYGADGSPVGMRYNGTAYYYGKNLFGDIVDIYDANGNKVAHYIYDAWGYHKILDADGNNVTFVTTHIGYINPIRYRGYYFDVETELYYLQTRYYDPVTGRFLNADALAYLGADGELGGYNLYTYCKNNPVMYTDRSGHIPEWLGWVLSGVAIVGGVILCATGVGGILGGILIGAGAGSLINGYVNKANGGSFTAGYIGGAISGALCGIGAGIGGLAFSAASDAINMACIGYLTLGAGASFAGGFAGNMVGTISTNWIDSGYKSIDINWQETTEMSILMGGLNIFAGIGSSMSTVLGTMGKTAINIDSKWAIRILAGVVAGATETLYDLLSYLVSELFF